MAKTPSILEDLLLDNDILNPIKSHVKHFSQFDFFGNSSCADGKKKHSYKLSLIAFSIGASAGGKRGLNEEPLRRILAT
jgi:hypothetical protein